MKTEAELRSLLDDIDLLCEQNYLTGGGPNLQDAFLHGISSGLAEALDVPFEKCGNPRCNANHRQTRIEGIARIREKAAGLRARQAQAKTS